MAERIKENNKEENDSKQGQKGQIKVKHSKGFEAMYFNSSRGEPLQATTSNYCRK